MGRLLDQLQLRAPVGSLARTLVESVEQLPDLADWSLPEPVGARFLDVFKWGQAITSTRVLPGTDELHATFGREVAACGAPEEETFAELSAGALCISLGSIAAGHIPTGPRRTADWRMVWPEAAEVDVEVTVAKRKELHVRRQAGATTLAAELFDSARRCDLVVNLVDPTNPADRSAVVKAATAMSCGESQSVPGSWSIHAVPAHREAGTVWTAGQDPAPEWWSQDGARSCAFVQQVGDRYSLVAKSQVRVWFGVPYVAYVNPVMRKADSPQGTEGLPFVVAVDVSQLPGAFEEIPRVAMGYLPFWTAVGGILLFESWADPERVGWRWRLVRNPNAAIPLPETLCAGRADLSRVTDSYRMLLETVGSSA